MDDSYQLTFPFTHPSLGTLYLWHPLFVLFILPFVSLQPIFLSFGTRQPIDYSFPFIASAHFLSTTFTVSVLISKSLTPSFQVHFLVTNAINQTTIESSGNGVKLNLSQSSSSSIVSYNYTYRVEEHSNCFERVYNEDVCFEETVIPF